jgi:hypothetical protein
MIRHKLLYRLIEIRISILGGFSLKDVAKKTVGFLKISKIRRVSLQDSENPRRRRPNLRETQLLPRRNLNTCRQQDNCKLGMCHEQTKTKSTQGLEMAVKNWLP